ncbi:MAG: lipid-A-disaccharide synthase [Ostreibacterium sp.]
MHIAMLAGEASGDQLGAELIKALRCLNPSIRFDGVGGELMQAEGFNSLLPMEEFSVMGISEIIRALPRLLRYKRKLIDNYQSVLPDAFIGIDYPEFNFSIEKRLKQMGIYTAQYVSPSVWAWREGRIHHIKESCDLMMTLFGFEKSFYDRHDMPAVHCGHPLVDMISEGQSITHARQLLSLDNNYRYLAILPGSRENEVKKMLPIFIATIKKLIKQLPNLFCLIPAINSVLAEEISTLMAKKGKNIPYAIYKKQAKTVMLASDAVLLSSGTATLEAMLLQKPMLVSYKVSGLTALLAKRMLKVSHFSLPNLLADHPIVPEFIQDQINTTEMAKVLYELLMSQSRRNYMIQQLKETRHKLRSNGADRAAKAIYEGLMYKEMLG